MNTEAKKLTEEELSELVKLDTARGVPGYHGYFADRLGGVWSTVAKGRGTGYFLLKQRITKAGYARVYLFQRPATIKSRAHGKFVHRVILETFIGPRKPNEVCRHLDGNKLNNCFSNLKWGTQKENVADQYTYGTGPIGNKNPNSVFTEEMARFILDLEKVKQPHGFWVSLARSMGVSRSAIDDVRKGRHWKHLNKN